MHHICIKPPAPCLISLWWGNKSGVGGLDVIQQLFFQMIQNIAPRTMPTTQYDTDLIWSSHSNPLNSPNYCYKFYHSICPHWAPLFWSSNPVLIVSGLKSLVSSKVHQCRFQHPTPPPTTGFWLPFRVSKTHFLELSSGMVWATRAEQKVTSALLWGLPWKGEVLASGNHLLASHSTYFIFPQIFTENLEHASQCSRIRELSRKQTDRVHALVIFQHMIKKWTYKYLA